ncbi:hypothetical protein ONZ45_g19204 [Pleurotus djamor]|nr:hypothetical protein ONZ45_g19204 [Pleurotus djamor]
MMTKKSATEVFDLLLKACRRLDIRHYHVAFPLLTGNQTFEKEQRQLWECLSNKVDSLSLYLLPQYHAEMASNVYACMSKVSHLALLLHSELEGDWTGENCRSIAKLINNGVYSFETLCIDNVMNPIDFIFDDLRPLYGNLGEYTSSHCGRPFLTDSLRIERFEKLRFINIQHKLGNAYLEDVTRFLNRQSHCLVELKLKIIQPFSTAKFLSRLSIKTLRSLDLTLRDDYTDPMRPGTPPLHLPALETLNIDSPYLLSYGLRMLLQSFRNAEPPIPLHTLSAWIWRYDNELLVETLSMFPSIRTLSIRFRDTNFLDTFRQSWPEHLRLPQCDLQDITITEFSPSYGSRHMYGLMKAVAAQIPTVRSFCGSGHRRTGSPTTSDSDSS